jgi:hypothetical protein
MLLGDAAAVADSWCFSIGPAKVRMQVHTRRARLALAPAYHLAYAYGSKYTPSRADIVPEQHEALLSGAHFFGGGRGRSTRGVLWGGVRGAACGESYARGGGQRREEGRRCRS